jgi:hypothetical protein
MGKIGDFGLCQVMRSMLAAAHGRVDFAALNAHSMGQLPGKYSGIQRQSGNFRTRILLLSVRATKRRPPVHGRNGVCDDSCMRFGRQPGASTLAVRAGFADELQEPAKPVWTQPTAQGDDPRNWSHTRSPVRSAPIAHLPGSDAVRVIISAEGTSIGASPMCFTDGVQWGSERERVHVHAPSGSIGTWDVPDVTIVAETPEPNYRIVPFEVGQHEVQL